MSDKTVKGTRDLGTDSSTFNVLNFLIETKIKGMVNTALPVIVTDVQGGGSDNPVGKVSVKPLITQTDAEGNALTTPEIYNLPYFRLQGGKVALVIDPVKDDVGLAIFAQQDVSNLQSGQTDATTPASFRNFDLADGFYIGGFLNKAPEVWLELKDDSVILHTAEKVIIEAKTVEVKCDEAVDITCKDATIKADSSIVLDSSKVELGSNAQSPAVKGDVLNQFFTTLMTALKTHTHTSAAPGVETAASVALASIQTPTDLNSTKVKVG